jgi:hypothetical protein
MSASTGDDLNMRMTPSLPAIASRLSASNGVTYYKGRLIADVAGVATKVTGAAGLKIRGVCDNSTFTADTSDESLSMVDVLAGQVALDISGTDPVTATDHLAMVYAEDDHTIARSSASSTLSPVGRLIRLVNVGSTTKALVEVGALGGVGSAASSDSIAVNLMPQDFYLLTGAPLAIFSNGASAVPGSAIVDSKAFAVRWNNNATLDGIVASFRMPIGADLASNATMTIYASKTGATVGDAVTFDIALYNQVAGALHDADANFGGTSSAMTGNATAKTIQAVTRTLTAADLAAHPASVTVTIKPTDGTLGTDDLVFLGARILFRRAN